MNFNFEMTIDELVNEMNNGGNQNELYKLSKINKDVIPYLFKAAGYIREKNKYVVTNECNKNITIKEILPAAKEMQLLVKLERSNHQVETKPTVIDVNVPVLREESLKQELIETNVGANILLNLQDKQNAKNLILTALDLTLEDLEAIKTLGRQEISLSGNIYDEINKLGSRKRGNRTFYVSDEIVEEVKYFCEEKVVKISNFIEIALLEALKKYK